MSTRKGAALIIASSYPEGVRWLRTYFEKAGVDAYIHVDRKSNILHFRREMEDLKHAHFLQDRVKVYWRGFTMIMATMALIEAAICHGDYDFFMLLSDDTLPLVTASKLRQIVESGQEFLELSPHRDAEFRERYTGFYMLDSEATQVRWIPLKEREVTPDTVDKILRLHALRHWGKKPIPTLYHGSQWWAMNKNNVHMVCQSWNQDIWLRQSFEFGEVPDEHYIQTIIGQEKDAPPWNTFIHTEWNVEQPPRVFKTSDEVRTRQQLPAPFIRKARLASQDLQDYILSLALA